jgi:hypothetical protein
MSKRNNNKNTKKNAKTRKNDPILAKKQSKIKERRALHSKYGLTSLSNGNVLIDDSPKYLAKLHRAIRDPDVFEDIYKQRKSQISAGAPHMDDFLVDTIYRMSAESGLSPGEIVDLASQDTFVGGQGVTQFSPDLNSKTIAELSTQLMLDAVNHNVDSTLEVVSTSVGTRSKAYMASLFLRAEFLGLANGELPKAFRHHPVLNRWLQLLTPRTVATDTREFALGWGNLSDYFSFFSEDELQPCICPGVTLGKASDSTGNVYMVCEYDNFPTYDEIIQIGTDCYIEIVTQLQKGRGGNRYELVDPLGSFPEQESAAAWAFGTTTSSSAHEATSMRFFSSLRCPVGLKPHELPYACSGFVKSVDVSDVAESFPVPGAFYISPAHFAYQCYAVDEYNSRRAVDWLVFPRVVPLEDVMTTLLAQVILADINVTETPVNFKGMNIGIEQADNSVVGEIGARQFTLYCINELIRSMGHSWVGVCLLPTNYFGFAGTNCFLNTRSYITPQSTLISEMLSRNSPVHFRRRTESGLNYTFVDLPIACATNRLQSPTGKLNDLDQYMSKFLFPNLSSGQIEYDWNSVNPVYNTYVNLGVGNPIPWDAHILSPTLGQIINQSMLNMTEVFARLEPAMGITLSVAADKYIDNATVSRMIVQPPVFIPGESRYYTSELYYFSGQILLKGILPSLFTELPPALVIGTTTDDLKVIEESAAALGAIFDQTERIVCTNSSSDYTPILLPSYNTLISSNSIGSKYDDAHSALDCVQMSRIVHAEGGFGFLLTLGSTLRKFYPIAKAAFNALTNDQQLRDSIRGLTTTSPGTSSSTVSQTHVYKFGRHLAQSSYSNPVYRKAVRKSSCQFHDMPSAPESEGPVAPNHSASAPVSEETSCPCLGCKI